MAKHCSPYLRTWSQSLRCSHSATNQGRPFSSLQNGGTNSRLVSVDSIVLGLFTEHYPKFSALHALPVPAVNLLVLLGPVNPSMALPHTHCTLGPPTGHKASVTDAVFDHYRSCYCI